MDVEHTYAVVCTSEEETHHLGLLLGQALEPGDMVGFTGPLGAGKTRIIRAIAEGTRVLQGTVVNSPTFTILNVYDTPDFPVFHLDLYRLCGTDDLESIGLPDMLGGDGVLLVEWFDNFPDGFPADHLHVLIEITGQGQRQFSFTACGPASKELLAELAVAHQN